MTQPCQSCSGRATVYLCGTCVDQLRALLNSLVTGPVVTARPDGSPVRSSGLLEDLADVILRRTKLGDGSGGGHRKRGDDNPGLYEPDTENGKRTRQAEAVMLLDAINNGLSTIVRDLCESRGIGVWRPLRTVERDFIGPLMPGWRRLPVGYVASSLDRASWLAANVGAIACDEAAGQWHGEIAGYVKRIESMIDRPQPLKLWGRCMSKLGEKDCATAIYGKRDAIEVVCPNGHCRTRYNAESLFNRNINASEYMHFTREELIGNQRTEHADRYWSGLMGELGEFVHYKQFQRWLKDGKLKPRRYQRPNGRHGFNRRTPDDIPEYLLADVRRVRRATATRATTAKVVVGE